MIQFPPNPAIGDEHTDAGITWQWDGVKWVGSKLIAGGKNIDISDVPPPSPDPGDLWWDNTGAQLYVWYDDGTTQQWVIVTSLKGIPGGGGGGGPGGGGATVSDAPPASPNQGDLWFDTVGAQLYIWDSAQWVIATNQPPPFIPPPVGITDGSEAAQGEVGEVIEVSLANQVYGQMSGAWYKPPILLPLTPGDWDVTAGFTLGRSTGAFTSNVSCQSLDAASISNGYNTEKPGTNTFQLNPGSGIDIYSITSFTHRRWNVTAPTVLCFWVQSTYTGNAPNMSGYMYARRMR